MGIENDTHIFFAFSHWPLAIGFFAESNGMRSRWSLNGNEWQRSLHSLNGKAPVIQQSIDCDCH